MEKLRFEFVVRASEDGKTNLAVTTITTANEKTYAIPEKYQPVEQHKELMSTNTYKKVKSTLQEKHQTRKVWINLSEKLSRAYLDDDGNLQFKDYLLEELTAGPKSEQEASGITEGMLTKILEQFSNKKAENDTGENLRKVSEKFVLEKFTNKSSSVTQWVELFERECDRLGVQKDEEKIEILRLFLEGSSLDWYSSMLIKLTLDSAWEIWKENFCETYADKGWSPIKYAISFKYINGPLLDYALKKERILLEMNKSMDKTTLIDLIAIGLPDFVIDKIDREKLKETETLFNELRSLEHLVKKNTYEKKKHTNQKSKEKRQEKIPCKICEKIGKKNRYHPEHMCWFKTNENDKTDKKNQIKYVNSSEIEAELNDLKQKNLTSHH